MKELETHLKIGNQERVELNIQKKKEIEHVLQGTLKPIKGHVVFEVNELTGEIKKAEYKRDTVVAFGGSHPTEKLVIKPDCVYIPALNVQNAKKKYMKDKNQSSYYAKEPIMELGYLNTKNSFL